MIILISTVLGFLAGLGVGGGSLLMLWLLSVQQLSYPEARMINLIFFIPTAVITTVSSVKTNRLNLKKILPCIMCGITASLITAFIFHRINNQLLRTILSLFMIISVIRELTYRDRNAR